MSTLLYITKKKILISILFFLESVFTLLIDIEGENFFVTSSK